MAKTPVMILQELTVHHGYSTPEYNVRGIQTGTHENEFYAEVTVRLHSGREVCAAGKASSKKKAKHDAAHKVLELLTEQGVTAEDYVAQHSPVKETVNCIMTLRDICVENKLPDPLFEMVSDVGPPHCREFTYRCKLGSMVTQATEGTKKQAKQVGAQKMLDKIKDILPELITEYQNSRTQVDEDTQLAVDKYLEYTENSVLKAKRNFAIPIKDYDKDLVRLMQTKQLALADFEELLSNCSLENVRSILEKLELSYEISVLQTCPIIVAFDVRADTPLTTIATGENEEDARKKAVSEMHSYLNVFLRINDDCNNE